MAREALFDILGEAIQGADVLDLFAGAGTVGIEALSRGARSCVFVERSPRVRQFLERNLERTRFTASARVIGGDVFRALGALRRLGRRFDLVFVGPPFDLWRDAKRSAALAGFLGRLATDGLLAEGCVAILQHEKGMSVPQMPDMLAQFDSRRYGRNVFEFFRIRPVESGRRPAAERSA